MQEWLTCTTSSNVTQYSIYIQSNARQAGIPWECICILLHISGCNSHAFATAPLGRADASAPCCTERSAQFIVPRQQVIGETSCTMNAVQCKLRLLAELPHSNPSRWLCILDIHQTGGNALWMRLRWWVREHMSIYLQRTYKLPYLP